MTSAANHGQAKPAFLAFASDDKDLETLRAFAAKNGWPSSVVIKGDIASATEFLKNNLAPSLLLVEIPTAEAAPGLLDALADVCDPHTKVITIGTTNEYSFYCWLIEIGIFSYLLCPLTDVMLDATYQKSIAVPTTPSQDKQSKVIAVMGARGGVGTTMVALNLAGVIANVLQKRTALVDIDPQSGTVSLALDIEPSRSLRDALEKPDRIDAMFIERVMSKVSKQLSVLSAEESLSSPIRIGDKAGEILIQELREKYEVILLDIPHHLDAFARECVTYADHVVVVSDLSLGGLRDTMRLSDWLRDVLSMKAPLVVANRVGLAPKQEMNATDFENGLGAKLVVSIPFAPELFMVVSNDIPAVKEKSHAGAQAVSTLVNMIIPPAKQKTAANDKKPFDVMQFLGKFKKKP